MKNSLVTIVIPTFNRASLLEKAIKSALAQSYTRIEVIVVDDNSTDGTQALMADFADPRLTNIRQEFNVGMPYSWGIGLRKAQGEFVCFLGDDDQFRKDFVRSRMRYMAHDPEIAVTFSPYDECTVEGQVIGTTGPSLASMTRPNPAQLMEMALTIQWFIGASLYRRNAIAPLWDQIENDGYVFDVGLHSRLIMAGGVGLAVPENDVMNTKHLGQTSHTKREMMFQQKSTLLTHLLKRNPPAPLTRVLKIEMAHWQVVWGRQLAEEGQLGQARTHFAEAMHANPRQFWVWKQLAMSWLWPQRLVQTR